MSFPTVLLHLCAYVQWFYHFCLFFHMQQERAEQDCSSPVKDTRKQPDLNQSTPLWVMSRKLYEQQLHVDDLTTLSTTNRINSQPELHLHCKDSCDLFEQSLHIFPLQIYGICQVKQKSCKVVHSFLIHFHLCRAINIKITKSLISFAYLGKKLLAAIPEDGMQDMPKTRFGLVPLPNSNRQYTGNSCARELGAGEGHAEAGLLWIFVNFGTLTQGNEMRQLVNIP